MEAFIAELKKAFLVAQDAVLNPTFLYQVIVIASIYGVAWLISSSLRRQFSWTREAPANGTHIIRLKMYRLGGTLFPIFTITLLKLTSILGKQYQLDAWLLEVAVVVAIMIFLNSFIRAFVESRGIANFLRWVGLPIVFLHMIDVLPAVIEAL